MCSEAIYIQQENIIYNKWSLTGDNIFTIDEPLFYITIGQPCITLSYNSFPHEIKICLYKGMKVNLLNTSHSED